MDNTQVSAVFSGKVKVNAPKGDINTPAMSSSRRPTVAEHKKVRTRMKAIATQVGGSYLGSSTKDGQRIFNFELQGHNIEELEKCLEETRSLLLRKPKDGNPKTVNFPTFMKLNR